LASQRGHSSRRPPNEAFFTHGNGPNITLQSYRDHLDFGFIAGANILPNVQSLADALPEELAKLEAAYGLAA
jgi:diacylglycerol O-acyltransferase / wax synthase